MLKQQILRGAVWLLVGRVVSQALGLLSTIIAARLLIPADFGLVAIAMGVFAIVGAVVELPVGLALVQLKTVSRDDFDTAFTLNALRGLLVAAMMLIAAWPMSIIFNEPRLIGLILALSLYPILLGFRNAHFEMYARQMVFKWESMVEVGTKVASFSATVLVAYLTDSYWALPIGLIASGAMALVMSFVLQPTMPRFCLKEVRKFFGFSVWLGLVHILDSLRDVCATFLLGKMLGTSKLGFYTVGSQFGDRLDLLLYSPVERTLFSAFSSIQDEPDRVRAAYLSSLHASTAVTLPICAGIGLLAPYIIAVALGADWAPAAMVLAFSAPITAIYMIGATSVALATSLGRTRSVFELKLVATLLYIPVLAAGTVWFGIIGTLWAGVFVGLLNCALSFRLVGRIIEISTLSQLSAISRSLFAATLMATVVLLARSQMPAVIDSAVTWQILHAMLLAGLGAATYFSCHVIIWFLSGRPDGIERMIASRLKVA